MLHAGGDSSRSEHDNEAELASKSYSDSEIEEPNVSNTSSDDEETESEEQRCEFQSSISADDDESIVDTRDIGKLLDLAVDVKALSRDDKYHLLTTEADPRPSVYPFSRPCLSSCPRRFRPDWVKRWPWMLYSHHQDGVYCRACVLFSPYQAGGQALGRFVQQPFQYWNKVTNKAAEHAKSEYHQNAIAVMRHATEILLGV